MTGSVLLPLSQGKFATIDASDFEKVGHLKWSLKKSKDTFYARRTVRKGAKQVTIFLHNVILGVKGVDHKSGDGLDNRRENLRPLTHQQNHQSFRHKATGCSSQYRGVSWYKPSRKWRTSIRCNYKYFYLGYFDDETDAARAYDTKAIELGFSKEALNFPV